MLENSYINLNTAASAELSNAVDAFLNNGGQVTTIPMGHMSDPTFAPKRTADAPSHRHRKKNANDFRGEDTVKKIKEYFAQGMTNVQIGILIGVTPGYISHIKSRHNLVRAVVNK